MNDLTAAELITRSFSQTLSASDLAALEQHLAQSPTTRAFADISQRIQQVITAKANIDSLASQVPGLSDVARARLERRMKQLISDKAASERSGATGQTPVRQVAESEVDYHHDNPANESCSTDTAGPTSENLDSQRPHDSQSPDE